MKKETVTEAFCRQSKIVPGSYEQSEEYEAKHGRLTYTIVGGKKISILKSTTKAEEAMGKANLERALKEFGKSADLRANSSINVPSKITKNDINQTPTSHPTFANYDHSLEQNRWQGQ